MMTDQRAWLGEVRLAGSPARPRPSLGSPAPARPALAGGGATTVTDDTFGQVTSAPMAIVDFWSPDCPYCVAFKPIFEEVASQVGDKILMAEALVDSNMKQAGAFKIEGLPGVVFLKDGKEVNRVEGKMERADFIAQIQKAFGAGAVAGLPAGAPAGTSAASAAPAGSSGILSGIALAGILGGVVYMIVTKS